MHIVGGYTTSVYLHHKMKLFYTKNILFSKKAGQVQGRNYASLDVVILGIFVCVGWVIYLSGWMAVKDLIIRLA